MKELIKLQSALDQLKGQKDQLKTRRLEVRSNRKALTKKVKLLEEAKEIVKIVAMKTQSEVSFHINDITGLALSSVMVEPYVLELNFKERRDKIECDFQFVRGDISIDPKEGGFGAVDIASFALRVASLSMQEKPSRGILILDEPFKHLKGSYANEKMLEMVSKISKKLNIQVIMVSDERVDRSITRNYADRLIDVKIKKGVSTIKIRK